MKPTKKAPASQSKRPYMKPRRKRSKPPMSTFDELRSKGAEKLAAINIPKKGE